jgi:(4S)-4-hydroxy-5-phosphonooxypentane-2,3-dione isomerase
MYIVHVKIHVKPEFVEEFKLVTIENAKNSMMEPGIVRFDLLQEVEDPTLFKLIEIYRTAEDIAQHKGTPHYNKWRELAEPMLAEERSRTVFRNIFPIDQDW